jgi:hypothetical protein
MPNKIVSLGLITAFLLVILPFLFYDVQRIGYLTSHGYAEGWNVYHTSRFLAGKPLYVPLTGFPLTPVNYPPLSFMIMGALSYFSGAILLTGRLVSLISLLFVGYLIFKTIENFSSEKTGALLGALVWLALMVRIAESHVGAYDPQMLGHVFSLGAFYLYSKWIDELTLQKTSVLALLCCFAFFIKYNLIAVPITLAITLFFSNRRDFWTFAFAGIVISSLMFLGCWLYGGEHFFSNFIEFDRAVSNSKMKEKVAKLLLTYFVWVLFLPFVMLLLKFPKKRMSVLIYFSFSFLLGSYFQRGIGVDRNAWFDFFIAVAIVYGLFAAESTKLKVFWSRILAYGILASGLLVFSINLKADLKQVLNYDRFKQQDAAYRRDVELLESIPGPALFEEPLLGFEAGKEFVFDPFNGSQMIVYGRIPEKILTDRIHEKYFGAIVLTFEVEKMLRQLGKEKIDPLKPKTILTERWTDNTLKTISENYELIGSNSPNDFFYLPRKT